MIGDVFNNAFSNDFLTFTLGVMFILSVYHALLYFQHKTKIYLLYAAYTFFIIMSQIQHCNVGFIATIVEPFGKWKYFGELYTEAYFVIYVLFAFIFLEMKSEFPRETKLVYNALRLLGSVFLLIFVAYYFFGINYSYVKTGYLIFVILITILSIYAYILFFKSKNPLRYYIIVGGLILSLSSYASLAYYFYLENRKLALDPAYSILYLGFILENVVFSLGLGNKQKNILDENNKSQLKLIEHLNENAALRKVVQEKLKQDVKGLSEVAAAESLATLEMRQEKVLAELKIASLRNQINPHFIFNSLNSIKRYIIDNEKENAVYYLNKFSKLIRKILSASMGKNITLTDEIETSLLYVNIENIRFNNSIDFALNINEDLNLETIKVPSLVLQPFIENAIWHGLSAKKDDKKLLINVDKENDTHLIIEIIDNGVGRKRSEEIRKNKIHKRESVGIAITEERLNNFAKYLNNAYKLHFEDLYDDRQNPKGTKVVLKIPLN